MSVRGDGSVILVGGMDKGKIQCQTVCSTVHILRVVMLKSVLFLK